MITKNHRRTNIRKMIFEINNLNSIIEEETKNSCKEKIKSKN